MLKLNSSTAKALVFLAGTIGSSCGISPINVCRTSTEIATENTVKSCDGIRNAEAKKHCKDLQRQMSVKAMSACMTTRLETPMICTEKEEDKFECQEVKK